MFVEETKTLSSFTIYLNRRSSIPVVTCVLAILVESRYPSRQEASALVILSVGVMIAVWQGTVTGSPNAIAFSIAGTLCNGAMMTFSGKVLSEKLDVVRLTFYTAPISLICLAPFYLVMEAESFRQYYALNGTGALLIMLVSSVNAVCYNMTHALMIKKLSAVTTTVVGEIKIVGLLILSAFLLGEGKEFTFKMTVGCTMAMVGFGLYSHTKIKAMRQAQHPTKVISLSASSDTLLDKVEKSQSLLDVKTAANLKGDQQA